ncbi:hypothetical protein EV368DRAFT_70282 [Lentinula lateritia]|nr:hypothetical protein EV368DRAFT_70282 [Lentinula lateritia]
MFEVITPIFTGLAHRLTESENRVAELQQGHISMEQLTALFREALSHNPSPPVQPVPPPQVHLATARAPLRMELPIFRGRPEDNARSSASDPHGVIISGCFRDAALTWYLAKKQENGDKPLTWDKLEKDLLAQFDNLSRTDDIRTKLVKCNYKNNVSDFITQFQKLEMQLPPTEMTFGDRKFNFFRSIPYDLCFHIANSQPASMAEVYEAARIWEHHHRISGQTSDPRCNHPSHTSSSSNHPSSTTLAPARPHVSSNDPTPMDLDTFSLRPMAPKNDKFKFRCYNCNKPGHYSKDCRLPDRRKERFNGNNQGPIQRTPQSMRTHPYQLPLLIQQTAEKSATPAKVSLQEVDSFLQACKPELKPLISKPAQNEVFTFSFDDDQNIGLPVYLAMLYGPRLPNKPWKHEAILRAFGISDTGAHWNYITRKSAKLVRAKIFDLVEPRTIAGAGHTVMKSFCRFWIWIGPIKEEICAYILEADSGF